MDAGDDLVALSNYGREASCGQPVLLNSTRDNERLESAAIGHGQGTRMTKGKSPMPCYFTTLAIENVRCFGADQRLDLTAENGLPVPWTLILGDNGVGKTTLLQCLAWMRPELTTKGDQSSFDEVDDSDELAPLSKGELGPALPSEQNDVLEGLLRKGETKVTLSAQLSFGTGLSSSGKGDGDGNGAPETLRIGTQLSFKENGQLWKQQYLPQPQPTVETELHGVFEEPLLVTYGANRLLGRQNVEKSDLEDPIASRLSEVTELYDMEEILSSLDYAWRKRKESKKSDE